MSNPPNFHQNPGSYQNLLKRITFGMQQQGATESLQNILQQTFERALEKENVLLERPERVRLYRQAASALLSEVLARIGGSNEAQT